MVVCLTSARFNMKADILRQTVRGSNDPVNVSGEWAQQQDPDSGELIRKWIQVTTDDPDTAYNDVEKSTFSCIARAIIDGGIRVSGTTERFGALYEGIDYVQITFPPNVELSRRDRVTNIRNARTGKVIWLEEERGDKSPTVFSVRGVSPVIDPYGEHIENVAMLERVEAQ